MNKKKDSLKSRIERLRNNFLSELPVRVDEIVANFHQFELQTDNIEIAKNLHRQVHNIKGTAASFGLKELGKIAGKIEPLLKQLTEPENNISQAALKEINNFISLFNTKAKETATLNNSQTNLLPSYEISAGGTQSLTQRSKHLVYICDDDKFLLEHMEIELNSYNFTTMAFESPKLMLESAKKQLPDVIIMDLIFPNGILEGIEVIEKLPEIRKKTVPVIFISGRNDFEARLRTVQAGGVAYFHKPFAMFDLLETIDNILFPPKPVPYRVLIVDDDVDISKYHSLILQEAGINVETLSEVNNILDKIFEFSPDLILMDMYMPMCNGSELAKLIRQIPDFVSLPIVYLSSETDKQNQFSALRVGADGFLTKPIEPQRLISEVLLRTERMKIIRSLMVSDSLTGLLNHTTILVSLETAIKSAERRNETLCFVMIDIDLFKKVNDSYGHAMGDQVILALSRLLKQRIRKSDVVGRYGGEEFALVLPNITLDMTMKIVNELRQAFAVLKFHSDQGDFSCTLSAGVSFYPEVNGKHALVTSADEALYIAKDSGRNCVIAYNDEPQNKKKEIIEKRSNNV